MNILLEILNREPGKEIVLDILRNYDPKLTIRGEDVSCLNLVTSLERH